MEWADLGKPILGFLLGLASAYIGLHWKIKKDLEAQYDKSLRLRRLKAYAELWKLLQPLARYSPPEPVTPAVLQKLSASLRRWYFEVGGLFMSKGTRDAYFALQDELLEPRQPAAEEGRDPWKVPRDLSSALRTATTLDVGSRQPPLVGPERESQ